MTHEGSSRFLDTGLRVYGPRNASGSYGVYPWAQDDNSGYGDSSHLCPLPLNWAPIRLLLGAESFRAVPSPR
jgi:hypothetical protein